MTKYNNILIPFYKNIKNNVVESNLGYIIQPMREKIGYRKGYIIISDSSQLPVNTYFRFFKVSGKKNFIEYKGFSMTNEKLCSLKNSLVNDLTISTINQFYKLSLDKNMEIPYNFLINLLEDMNLLRFQNNNFNISNKDYETKCNYTGKSEIFTTINGEGKTIDAIVKLLKEKYELKKITRYIYKYFLCHQGLDFLRSRISGVKNSEINSSSNGGNGYRYNVTYLFSTKYIENDLEKLKSLIELRKRQKEETKLMKLILS